MILFDLMALLLRCKQGAVRVCFGHPIVLNKSHGPAQAIVADPST